MLLKMGDGRGRGREMKDERRTPYAAVRAAELTMVAIIGSVGVWYGHDVVIRALQLVVDGIIG